MLKNRTGLDLLRSGTLRRGLRAHRHDLGFLARAESLDLAAKPARGSAKRIVSQVGVTLGRSGVGAPERVASV